MRIGFAGALAALVALPVSAGNDTTELPRSLRLVEVKASSTRAGKTLDAYAAWKVLDGDAETIWCEGKPGGGTGESLTVTFLDPVRVDEIQLVTGIPQTPELFEANNVPSVITLTTDDGRTVEGMDGSLVEGAFDYMGTATIELGPPAVKKLTLTLATVEKVTAANHTCIADLRISSGGDDVEPLVGLDALALKGLPAALQGLVEAFAKCDQTKLADRAQFPLAFDFLQPIAPGPGNGFLSGTRPARASWRAAVDLAERCKAADPGAPSIGETTEVDGLIYTARSAGPGVLTVRVDTREGETDTWRLAWRDRRWKLIAVSRLPE